MPSLELHRPITLPCGLTLPNRLIKAAIAETWAGTDMLPHQKMLDTYGAWADGDWGLVVTGNVQVDAVHLGTPNDHAINTDIPYEKLIQSWKQWAEVANRSFTPTIIQLNHPGRQSLPGAGTRGLFSKTIAPSVVPVQLGAGYIARFMSALVFGSPREMTVQDIRHVIDCFVAGAKTSHEAGFAGVQIHAAHGYLLAQFLSAKTNHRCDDYGGSPKNRSRIVVEILHEIRQTLPKEFCVGIKLNSVDHQSKDELRDCIQQLEDIIGAGIDLLEVSGGTYENPTVSQLAYSGNEYMLIGRRWSWDKTRISRKRFLPAPFVVKPSFLNSPRRSASSSPRSL